MITATQPEMTLYAPATINGVTIRPIQRSDATLLYELHQRLSPDSIYYRYLQYRRPTLAELTPICGLTPERGAGFVAITQTEPVMIVGMAYYVREQYALEPTAEPGILVEDRFQAQGLGRRLWQQVQQQARMDGLRWLRVWSHPGNHRIAQLVRGGGFPYRAKAYDGLSEYLIDLGQPLADQAGVWINNLSHSRLLSCGCAENRRFPQPVSQEVNAGFHPEQRIEQ